MVRGKGSFYLPTEQAIQFIQSCEENNLAVVHVEGFEHNAQQDWIRPRMDLISDETSISSPLWSGSVWQSYRSGCNTSAVDLVNEVIGKGDFVFNFVLFSEQEWIVAKGQEKVTIEGEGKRTYSIPPALLKQLPERGLN